MIVEKKLKLASKVGKTLLDRMVHDIIERDNEAEIQVKAKSIKDYVLKNQSQ